MAENKLSTITQFEEIIPADDDILLVSHKDGDQYVSRRAKISNLPFVYTDNYATAESAGLMQVGNGLKANILGKVEVDYSKLPVASKSKLGVIKVGANLKIDNDGTLSAGNSYELPVATSDKLGGVKIGAGIVIAEDGTVSVPVSGVTKLKAGTNISITPEEGTGEVTIAADKQIDNYVSKIIAGDNITISPVEGTGQVKISSVGSGGESILMPAVVGSIVPYMGTDIPEGYLMCDGSEVSKEAYSELYTVISDRFGIASDASKFKLPKIDDARYLQGSNTPGTVVDEELPNITGKIDASSQNVSHQAFGETYLGNTITEGAFKDGLITGQQEAIQDAELGTMIKGFTFDASKSSAVYKDNGHVVPNSVTVRYLICYKKVIGKVDAMIGMPDYSKLYKIEFVQRTDEATMYDFFVPEDGYVFLGYGSQGNVSDRVYVNDKEMWFIGTADYKSDNICIPVSVGDKVTVNAVSTKTTFVGWFTPLKASPSKLSELFMGAPDWDKLTEDAKIFDKILNDNTEEEFESSGDGFCVVRCDAANTYGLYVSKNGIIILGCNVYNDDARNVYASVIPCSKGDKFVIGNAQHATTNGATTAIHAYVYFIPRKKI